MTRSGRQRRAATTTSQPVTVADDPRRPKPISSSSAGAIHSVDGPFQRSRSSSCMWRLPSRGTSLPPSRRTQSEPATSRRSHRRAEERQARTAGLLPGAALEQRSGQVPVEGLALVLADGDASEQQVRHPHRALIAEIEEEQPALVLEDARSVDAAVIECPRLAGVEHRTVGAAQDPSRIRASRSTQATRPIRSASVDASKRGSRRRSERAASGRCSTAATRAGPGPALPEAALVPARPVGLMRVDGRHLGRRASRSARERSGGGSATGCEQGSGSSPTFPLSSHWSVDALNRERGSYDRHQLRPHPGPPPTKSTAAGTPPCRAASNGPHHHVQPRAVRRRSRSKACFARRLASTRS